MWERRAAAQQQPHLRRVLLCRRQLLPKVPRHRLPGVSVRFQQVLLVVSTLLCTGASCYHCLKSCTCQRTLYHNNVADILSSLVAHRHSFVCNGQRTMLCSTSGRQLQPPMPHASLRSVSSNTNVSKAVAAPSTRRCCRRSTIVTAAAGPPKAPGRPGKTPDDIVFDEAYYKGEVR